jgi:acetyl-CoA carboxylase, biotin carboxylase subunit
VTKNVIKKKFNKVLISNRGEIAIRVIRSCKELGLETVGVHSTEDEDSLHVKMAEESVCIGLPRATSSYLNIPSILSAAEITNSDAIHPGYGFLSESSEFAQMCEKWNLTFIGPKAETLEVMGDKIKSKEIAKKAGIPILEPICVAELEQEQILAEVTKMGLPVIIKASAGGGGRGMKKIYDMSEIMDSIYKLTEEAKVAFGDGTLFIEKYIEKPRHIEVQIVGDKYGNVIHLFERDCTIQRRFQKIIEEAPSMTLTEEIRTTICESAVNLAKAVSYDSVGTVEFLYDTDCDKFYFMEMNTRIQVEHPVTEELTGIDLIALQISIAQGEELKLKQSDIKRYGHVIECRINAEDPETERPSPGLITHYHRPGGFGVRVDDFIYTGYKVSPYYDSMISKIIVRADTRENCIIRMLRALDETVVGGIKTNIQQHCSILRDEDFRANNYTTNYLSLK